MRLGKSVEVWGGGGFRWRVFRGAGRNGDYTGTRPQVTFPTLKNVWMKVDRGSYFNRTNYSCFTDTSTVIDLAELKRKQLYKLGLVNTSPAKAAVCFPDRFNPF